METPQHIQTPPIAPVGIEADLIDDGDRTQIFLAKYNLDIVQPKWPARNIPPVERVSKSIRMRVRYTCHRCQTTFGHDKECNSCRHRRCARCDRYPPRKPRPQPELVSHAPAPTAVAATEEPVIERSGPSVADSFCTCHECDTVIEVEVEECPKCHHAICEQCHKEAQVQNQQNTTTPTTTMGEEQNPPPEEQKLPPDDGGGGGGGDGQAKDQQPTTTS